MTTHTLPHRAPYGRPVEIIDEHPRPAVHRDELHHRPAVALVGRFLMAAIFLVSGIAKLTDTSGTAAHMAGAGIPEPETLAVIVGIAELAGAAALIFGLLARAGAIGLILFLIPATLIFHNFWAFEGAERTQQMISFLKNLALMGGLAMVVAFGAGRYSVDARYGRSRAPVPG